MTTGPIHQSVISFITNEEIIVTLQKNRIAGAL